MAGFIFLFQAFFLLFPFSPSFLVRKSIFRGCCFPHTMLQCCWATVGFHRGLLRPSLGFLGAKTPQIPINNRRTDAFWDFPPKSGFTGVSIGTRGERNSECKFCFRLDLRVLVPLTHQTAQISLFYPQCCGRLVTLDTTFWKREDIPPNPFIYVLKTPLNLEKNHPILILKG